MSSLTIIDSVPTLFRNFLAAWVAASQPPGAPTPSCFGIRYGVTRGIANALAHLDASRRHTYPMAIGLGALHKAENQKAENQKAENQKAENQKAENQKAENQKTAMNGNGFIRPVKQLSATLEISFFYTETSMQQKNERKCLCFIPFSLLTLLI